MVEDLRSTNEGPGSGDLVRLQLADVRHREKRCPQQLAAKVRPGAPRPRRATAAPPALTSWAMGPFHDVLDLVEFQGLTPEEALTRWRASPNRPVHPALARWTEHAVHGYLDATAALPAAPAQQGALEPVSRLWARQRGSQPGAEGVYEEMVVDRRYAGSGIRELRIVRTGSVKDRPRDDVEIAVAVGVLAGGSPVLSSRWDRSPLRLGRFESARLVRLVEIGCVDATHRVLFEGTPQDAYDRYVPDVRAQLDQIVSGTSYRPGESCGKCAAVADCPAVPAVPGLLGIDGPSAPRRSWSMTTGRSHRRCPARAHLESLLLPRDTTAEDGEAVVRGKAVHAWIESRHRRSPRQPCAPDDVPGPSEAWQYEGWALTGLQARLGIQMISDHAVVCPLRDLPGEADVHPERTVAAYDPRADVVVIAKTDLLYRAGNRWALRETKTAKASSEGNLLDQHPQLALSVVLASSGALPGDGSCRVELERLTGSGPIVTALDVTAPDVLQEARTVLTPYVAPWHADARYPAKPGKACLDCPFTRWCPDARDGKAT